MSGQHTQGRLTAMGVFQNDFSIVGPYCLASDQSPVLGKIVMAGGYMTEADARRLAACWNACEGMTTNDVEILAYEGVRTALSVNIRKNIRLEGERSNLERRISTQRREIERLLVSGQAVVDDRDADRADSRAIEANYEAARALLTDLLDNSTAFTSAIEIDDAHKFDGEAWANRARAFLNGGA